MDNEQARATLSLGVGRVALTVAGIVTAKVFALWLGPSGLGIVSQLRNLQSLLIIAVGFGMTNGIVVLAAESSGKEGRLAFQRLTSTALVTVTGSGTLVALGVALASRRIAAGSLGDASASHLVLLLSVAVFIKALNTVMTSLLQGLLEIRRLVLVNIVAAIATIATSALVIWWDVTGYALASIIISSVQVIVSCRFLGAASGISLRAMAAVRRFRFGIARRLLGFGSVALGSQGIQRLESVVVTSLIISRLGAKEAGQYAVVYGIPHMLLIFLLQANSTYALPKVSAGRADPEQIVSIKHDALRVLLSIWLPTACVLLILRSIIIPLLYQEQFLPAARFMSVQLLGDLGVLTSRPLRVGLLPTRHFKAHVGLMALQSIIRIGLLFAFIGRFGLWAVVVSYAVAAWSLVFLAYVSARKHFGFSFTRESIIFVGAVLTVFVIVGVLVYSRRPLVSYGVTSLLVIIWGASALPWRQLMVEGAEALVSLRERIGHETR